MSESRALPVILAVSAGIAVVTVVYWSYSDAGAAWWWRVTCTNPSHAAWYDRLQSMDKAAKIIIEEFNELQRSIQLGVAPGRKLKEQLLSLSDDVDYVLKGLDELNMSAKVPEFLKKMKKSLTAMLADYGSPD